MNVSLKLRGTTTLINKLNALSNIKAKEGLYLVAKEVASEIKSTAPRDSGGSASHIDVCEVRDYGLSCFIDVGLANTSAPWDSWKGLWFQNYGYHNWGLGGMYHGVYVSTNIGWFNNAIDGLRGETQRKINAQLRLLVGQVLNS